jgi:1A family penicillin-binding protein
MSLLRFSSFQRQSSKQAPEATSKNRKGHFFQLFKKALLVCVGVGAVVVFCFTIFLVWVSRDLPNPDTLSTREVPQSTKIYDRTGTVLLRELHGDEKRTLVKIDQIPLNMQHATISIEDRTFYQHHGIYWKGLIRAFGMSILTRTSVKGTSTLTQQLVKNAILTNERSIMRKAKEFVLSLQIERTFSKQQILQLYLNEIPYGSTIYGIESASQSYFGKSAKDLTLDESALLAAIPQAPDLYSPYGTGSRGDNRARLVVRQHYILDVMAEEGYITKDEAEAAKKIPTLDKIKPKTVSDFKAPHFVTDVRAELVEAYGIKRTEEGGLKVITTLDWDKQQVAEKEIVKGVEARGKAYKFTNAALVSLDPKTGQVLAMVGSKDFNDDSIKGQVNVTRSARQPGSSFKPIVYSLAFARGYLPQTVLWDVDTIFRTDSGNYTPHDYDLKQRGPLSIRMALQNSLNTPAVKTMYLVGLGRVLDYAERLGYTTLGDRSRFSLSLALGSGEVKPIEHAATFAAFANDGIKMPTVSILRVEDHDGTVLQEWKPSEGTRVLDSQAARLLADVMTDNQARALVFSPAARNYLTLSDRPVAAKTGTTNNFNDAWTVGFTPNLATVVWVGNSDGKEMSRGADGSVVAAPIWGGYMKAVTKSMPIERFKAPEPPSTDKPALLGTAIMQKVRVVKTTGNLASDLTPPELTEDRIYYSPHEILSYLDKDDPTGPAPSNPAADPQFENWERAVQLWVSKTTSTQFGPPPTEVDVLHTPEMQPVVTILSPTGEESISSRILPVQVSASTPRTIQLYEVLLNGQTIGTANNASFSVILPQDLVAGRHTLTIVAVDDIGNRGETSVAINYLTAAPATLPPPTDTGISNVGALMNTSGTGF